MNLIKKILNGGEERHRKPEVPGVLPVDYPTYTTKQERVLAIATAKMIGSSIESMATIRQFGNVYIIRFSPTYKDTSTLFQIQPIFPFVFRAYGNDYLRAYRQMAEAFVYDMNRFPYKAMMERAILCGNCVLADTSLRNDVAEYYLESMMWIASSPHDAIMEINWF
jgi:hypothetical protein